MKMTKFALFAAVASLCLASNAYAEDMYSCNDKTWQDLLQAPSTAKNLGEYEALYKLKKPFDFHGFKTQEVYHYSEGGYAIIEAYFYVKDKQATLGQIVKTFKLKPLAGEKNVFERNTGDMGVISAGISKKGQSVYVACTEGG